MEAKVNISDPLKFHTKPHTYIHLNSKELGGTFKFNVKNVDIFCTKLLTELIKIKRLLKVSNGAIKYTKVNRKKYREKNEN